MGMKNEKTETLGVSSGSECDPDPCSLWPEGFVTPYFPKPDL